MIISLVNKELRCVRFISFLTFFLVQGETTSKGPDTKEEGAINMKNQSVLQTKLTKLAIQIGYAGELTEISQACH